MNTNYITVKEYAEKYGYSENTVRKWCRNGQLTITLKAIKESGRWKIPVDAPCPRNAK